MDYYTENILPRVGISIGLTRLFFVLKEIGFIDKFGVENVILIGEEEVKNNKVKIKNMKSGDNITIDYNSFVSK